jgi:extracellular factor (EF) 3-hydroxypalmitic acid methyl ester biosynthesis protein
MLRDEGRSASESTFEETLDETHAIEAEPSAPLMGLGGREAITAEASAKAVAAGLSRLHAELRERAPVVSRETWSGLLDGAYSTLKARADRVTLEKVFLGLKELKTVGHPQWWDQFTEHESLEHPIREMFHADPFTRRSFEKPRGYAGDAVMLDYIYGVCPPPPDTSEIGRQIFDFTTAAPASQSVRARRDILARAIDETADRFPAPNVLAIACGHLREAALSRAVAEGRFGQYVALDQDAESLAVVERTCAGLGIRTVNASVKGIVAGKVKFRDQHLVYAAGLYDYLADRLATRLTKRMFDMLAPGGRLLIANFAPTLRDIGYMETYMGWKLIYRTPEQMQSLADEIPRAQIASGRLFWDDHHNIVFLDLTRA